MRLISKFHDYYDAAQGQGVDLTRVFLRQTVEVTGASRNEAQVPAQARAFFEMARGATSSERRYNIAHKDEVLETVNFGLVFFAGRLYPFGTVTIRERHTYGLHTQFYYSLESLEHAIERFDVDLRGKKTKRRFPWSPFAARNVEPFFALQGSEALRAKATETGLSIASYTRSFDQLQVNPRLSDFQFFKALDAWQAYQELAMYVGNLAAPERIPVSISDKDRIYQHGFDKMSFRKPPQS